MVDPFPSDAETRVHGPRPAIEAAPPSAQIGRYLIEGVLGKGAMGTVYRAHDPSLDRPVAIKLLRHHSHDPRLKIRLQREAQAMARISHANVVVVHDVGESEGELFIAMEYVPAGTLADWLSWSRPWQSVVNVFLQTGAGLAAAHGAGLVHRDFKPANVLLNLYGQPKITDFGLVCATQQATPRRRTRSALDTPLTRVGTVLGTPAYMAPEQFRGKQADARSDQFAFCIALHEALWGASPFSGKGMRQRGDNVMHNRRTPRPSASDVPVALEAVVDRGLEPDPASRWPSIAALLHALSAGATQTQPKVTNEVGWLERATARLQVRGRRSRSS